VAGVKQEAQRVPRRSRAPVRQVRCLLAIDGVALTSIPMVLPSTTTQGWPASLARCVEIGYVFYGIFLTEVDLSQTTQPNLEAGRAYRTRDLRRWGANPTRLARRLVSEGKLREAARGLFYAPTGSRFGPAPAREDEILRAFFAGSPFVITGPPRWNTLGLGSTAMFVATLVYNKRRTGEFTFDGRRFLLRRVLFPESPPPEWFVIDLLQHHEMAGVSLAELEERLVATLREGRWNRDHVREMAVAYGTKATLSTVERCLDAAGPIS